MAKIIIINFICSLFFFSSCRSSKVNIPDKQVVNCSNDSLRNKEFFNLLKDKKGKDLNIHFIERRILLDDNFSKTDCYCKLLIYATLFDFLIREGINLKHKGGDINIHNIMLEYATEDELNEIKKDNLYIEESNLYGQFLDLKSNQNDIIAPIYKMDKTKSFEKDVDQIISSGLYQNPQQLKYMLMVDYEDLLNKLKKDLDEKN